ncbi:hypothetical protein VP01_292g6 [Puccinia sorghi]|uniref:Uncharacterized protein n=1 Tax=Puccinia sorghi TaxID=27349 RepID=A0A0L6V1Z0_9BASI|nr:hypothetical protein VP01_292g6 [Puccinia sorghi]
MASQSSTAQATVTAILTSQLISLPFSCSLTALVSIMACRYLSKTSSTRGLPKLGYFEYPQGNHKPARIQLARIGCGLVALISVILTCFELVHVYQSTVQNPRDITYFQKTPWTFALIPGLTAIVNATSQLYFSEKACRNHLQLRLLTVLGLLNIFSITGGVASSIAMGVCPSRWKLVPSRDVRNREAIQGVFGHFNYLRRYNQLPAYWLMSKATATDQDGFTKKCSSVSPRPDDRKFERFTISSIINFFVSTFTLVFMLQIISITCACASFSSNFAIALHSGQALLFLQKLTIGFTSLSLVYDLLVESSSSPSKGLAPQVTFDKIHHIDTESGRLESSQEIAPPARPNRPNVEVDGQDIGRFDLPAYSTPEQKPLTSQEEEEFDELFADTFPSEIVLVKEDTPVTHHSWPPIVNRISASLSMPEKALGEFSLLRPDIGFNAPPTHSINKPNRNSSLLVRQKQPSVSPMRSLQLSSDTAKPLPSAVNQRSKKSPTKSKNRQSQLKYIISSPIS